MTPSGFSIDKCGYCFIPEGVTYIPYHEFMGTDVAYVYLPSTVNTIGASAFRECQNLTTVVLDEGLEVIEHSAFERCSKLTSVDLPDTLRAIESSAFEKCVSLREIIIPETLEYLGSLAFTGCSKLESISVPKRFCKDIRYISDITPIAEGEDHGL